MLTFNRTKIEGVVLVDTLAYEDNRGGFTRLYCPKEFEDAGISFTSAQINLSTNRRRHTLRGMHYQLPPHDEAKFVRVINGRIFDVVVDLRPKSKTYLSWVSFELSRENGRSLLIPSGCAHGFLTLEDNSDVLYQMDRLYVKGYAAGFRFDDPAVKIEWPDSPEVISDADLAWPSLPHRDR